MKMMGVTRNKLSPPSSSPSSSSSIIARVFPVSWFTKRKQKVEKPETRKGSENDPLDSLFPNSRARFQSMDEGDPFHGSDEKGGFPARRSTGGMTINPVFYEPGNFDDMVLHMQRMKGSAKTRREVKEMKVKAKKKGKAYSPRTECKIRALEEMKRARMMMKKRVKEGKSVFNSFAVVRNSFDPHRDFRDSMVEMIMEERIRQPEDLELLLACYLDINSHEYHGIIINAFKHVCLEFFFSF